MFERERLRRSVRHSVAIAAIEFRSIRTTRLSVVFGLFLLFSAWRLAGKTTEPSGNGITITWLVTRAGTARTVIEELSFTLIDTGFHVNSLTLLVPLFSVLLGTGAIVTKRDHDRIRQYQSYAVSTRSIVAGLFLGRAALLLIYAVGALTISKLIVVRRFGVPVEGSFGYFAGAVVLSSLVWLAIGFSISSMGSSYRAAVAVSLTAFVVLLLQLYTAVLVQIHQLLATPTTVQTITYLLDPIHSFAISSAAPYDSLIPNIHLFAIGYGETPTTVGFSTAYQNGVSEPWFVSWPIAVLVQCGWILASLEYATVTLRQRE